jgi:TatD DNase family protein
MSLPLYDAHNHLQDAGLRPHRATVFADLEKLDTLRGAVVNGTAESDWAEVAALARAHAWVYPAFGLHPWKIKDRTPEWQAHLLRALDAGGANVSLGEIGLDHWVPGHDRDDQREVFVWQLRVAVERNLPVTVHCLQAWGALAEVLRTAAVPARGFLLHAYGGPAEMVGPLAKRGGYFSFNGAHLTPRKAARRAVFSQIPLERLLVETDAPAMPSPPEHAPFTLPPAADDQPMNHPANLAATYHALAGIRGLPVEELAAQVEENFRRLFD